MPGFRSFFRFLHHSEFGQISIRIKCSQHTACFHISVSLCHSCIEFNLTIVVCIYDTFEADL